MNNKIDFLTESFIFITASLLGQLFDGMLTAIISFFWSMVGWLCYRYYRVPFLLFLKKYLKKEYLNRYFKQKLLDECFKIDKENKKEE